MGDLPSGVETSHAHANYSSEASEALAQPRPAHAEDARHSVGAMRTAIISSKSNSAVSGLDMNRNPSLAFPKPSSVEGINDYTPCRIAFVCVCVFVCAWARAHARLRVIHVRRWHFPNPHLSKT
jgi:hypothetical protein